MDLVIHGLIDGELARLEQILGNGLLVGGHGAVQGAPEA